MGSEHCRACDELSHRATLTITSACPSCEHGETHARLVRFEDDLSRIYASPTCSAAVEVGPDGSPSLLIRCARHRGVLLTQVEFTEVNVATGLRDSHLSVCWTPDSKDISVGGWE